MTDVSDQLPGTSVLPDQHASFQLNFNDKETLFQAYLPFVIEGALFIRTNKTFKLGDQVHLKIQLPEDPTEYELMSKVVWITPKCAQGGRPAGVGAQLQGEIGTTLRQKIDTHLAGMQDSARINNTM